MDMITKCCGHLWSPRKEIARENLMRFRWKPNLQDWRNCPLSVRLWGVSNWDFVTSMLQLAEFFPMQYGSPRPFSKKKSLSFLSLDFLTIQSGDGPMTYMVTATQETSGPTWSSCTTRKNHSPLLFWKQPLLRSTRVPLQNPSFSTVLFFFGGGKRTTLNWTNIFRIFCWDPMPVKVDPDVRTSSPAVTQWSPIWMKHIAVTLHILCTGLSKNLRLSKQQIQEVCFMEVNVSPSSHSCLAFGTGASGENNSANKTWYTGSKIFSLWYNIYVCCRPASTDFTTTFSHPALWVCLFSSVKPASLPRPLAAQPYGLPRT